MNDDYLSYEYPPFTYLQHTCRSLDSDYSGAEQIKDDFGHYHERYGEFGYIESDCDYSDYMYDRDYSDYSDYIYEEYNEK